MSVSDLQFANWLGRDSSKKTWLVEIDYKWAEYVPDVWTVNTATIYVSTHPYQDASTPYIDVVRTIPSFNRQLDRKTLGGAGSRSFGSLILDNPDGELDFLLKLALDGSDVRVYVGDRTWARSDFRLFYTAVSLKVNAPTTGSIEIPLSDRSAFLNASVEVSAIGGTGINAEKMSPLLFGNCHNVEALEEDYAEVKYRLSQPGGSIISGTAVRDAGLPVADLLTRTLTSGVSIDTSTDFITYSAHGYIDEDIVQVVSTGTYPTGLPTGYYFVRNKTTNTFQLSATRTGSVVNFTTNTWTGFLSLLRYNYTMDVATGVLTLAHPPAGTVTCDTVDSNSLVAASDIIDLLVADYTKLSGAQIEGAHASYNVDGLTDFQLGLRIDAKQNILDLLTKLCDSAIAFHTFTRESKFTYGRICPASLTAGTSQMTFTMDDVEGQPKLSHADPLYWRWNWYFNKNWTVQSPGSLSPILTLEEIATYASKGEYGTGQVRQSFDVGFSTALTLNQTHLTMTESPERETLLSRFGDPVYDPGDGPADGSESTLWYQTIYDQLKPWVEFLEITVGLEAYTLELGDVVRFYHPDRYNLVDDGDSTLGAKFQVCGINIKPIEGNIDLVLVRNRTADISSGAYNA